MTGTGEKPDFIAEIQREDARSQERRSWLRGVRSLFVAMLVMIAIGVVFVAVWLHYYKQSWLVIVG